MVKLTTTILPLALLFTGTLIDAMDSNCKGSYFCGHGYHQRCPDRTIEKLRHLFHAEVQEGNGEMWYPSGGAHIACLAAKKGACCARWNGKLANGTISEALHFMDRLIQFGCEACGSTLIDNSRPGELTVNYERELHPECDAKLCPGGVKGPRPKPTWTPPPPKSLETKTRAPEEQTSALAAESSLSSAIAVAAAASSIVAAESAARLTSLAQAATRAAASRMSEQSASAAKATSTTEEMPTSKSDTASDNGDVTVTEKETRTESHTRQ